jgi:hypothetical protein
MRHSMTEVARGHDTMLQYIRVELQNEALAKGMLSLPGHDKFK